MDDKTCTKCKETKPLSDFYVRSGRPQSQCKKCVLSKNKTYTLSHRAAANAATKRYRERNLQKVTERKKQYRENNADKLKEYERTRWAENKDALTAKFNAYKQNNRSKFCAYQKNYAASHPVQILQIHHKRRARLAGADGSFTLVEWQEMLVTFGNKCLCCGVSGDETPLTIDHVLPIACGGSNDISNIQPLCKPCNSKKHTRHIDYRVDTTLRAA